MNPAALSTPSRSREPPRAAPAPAPTRSQRASRARLATPRRLCRPAGAGPPRETVQEIVPPAESKQLKEQAQSRRQEVNKILGQVGRRSMTKARQNAIATIKSFLALSEEAESRNDMRQADGFAERAQILAKELQSGQ